MPKRDRTKEKEFERILEENFGRIAIIEYEGYVGKRIVGKLVVGKIGEFEKDFTNSKYGNSVYLKTISEEEKFRVLNETGLIEREGRKIILGEEKGNNYREKYHTRRITGLELI